MDRLQGLLAKIEARTTDLDKLTKHWNGKAPAAFLAESSRATLNNRLSLLSVNFPRLVISSGVDRLQVAGFRKGDELATDHELRKQWAAAGMQALAELIHTDRALYGSAYVTVWGHSSDHKRPVVRGDNPYSMAVEQDGGTGEILSAVRRWTDDEGAHAILFTQNRVTRYISKEVQALANSGSWKVQDTFDNGMGVVPVVPFVRRQSLLDYKGTSAVADILDLTDALAKIMQDAMVTSEDYARPRRWATGLEIEEDEDGNVIDPFGTSRVMQSESEDTKFGQFDPARLDSYSDLIATITQQIGSLSGLPAHYLGLHGDQPPNAEGVRAAEAQLTSRAYSEQRQLSGPWAEVAALIQAVVTETDPMEHVYSTQWASPEIRTPAQAADAALKLSTIGVPLESLLSDPLGYEPHQVEAIMKAQRQQSILTTAAAIGRGA